MQMGSTGKWKLWLIDKVILYELRTGCSGPLRVLQVNLRLWQKGIGVLSAPHPITLKGVCAAISP